MSENLSKFGKLVWRGRADDGKRGYIEASQDDGWKSIRLELDTDDCDTKHALAFKAALLKLWNNQ